jgi:hypothetical protein
MPGMMIHFVANIMHRKQFIQGGKGRMKNFLLAALVLAVAVTGVTRSQGLETFDNLTITGTSYQNGTFLGQDGSEWTFVQCRGDYSITGKSIMLGRNRTPQSEVYSGTISNGMGELNFNYMQAFSTNVNLNVEINGVVVGNVTSSGEQGVIKNSGTIVVNHDGDFVIRFINVNNSDGQVVIDDVEWTAYSSGPPTATPTAPTPTPTTTNTPTATPTPLNLTIYDIQYTADPGGSSPYVGQTVITSGIITAVQDGNPNIFIQDGTGPWNGILLYGISGTGYAEGDELEVTGTVSEYYGMTEISSITTIDILSSGNPLPDFTVITTAEVSEEQYESVLCRVENVTVTNPNLGFNEWEIDDGSGPAVVNDLFYEHVPQMDDVYGYVQGPIDYSFSVFKLEPRYEPDIDSSPPEPTPSPTVVPTIPCGEELLWNGGMEDWSAGPGGPPDYWMPTITSPTPGVSIEQTDVEVHTGTYAALTTKLLTGTQHFQQLVPYEINPGADYTFSYWIIDNDGISTNRSRGWINWYSDPEGTAYLGQAIESVYSIDQSGWQQMIVTGTAPDDAVSARVRIAFYGDTGVQYYVDTVSLEELCPATPTPTETPEPTVTPTPGTPTETPVPPPIPATGPAGIGLLLLGLGVLLSLSGLRRNK